MIGGMKMRFPFEPLKHRCPICDAQISSEIEINLKDKPRFKRVSDWVCKRGHKVEDKALLDKLEASIESFNLGCN